MNTNLNHRDPTFARPLSLILQRLINGRPLLNAAVACLLMVVSAHAKAQHTLVPKAVDTPNGSVPMQAATTGNVADCVAVEAVLLPRKPVSKLFGGYVADNFAVVKTTVSNSCDQQQFVLHNIYFDYSKWALSGVYKSADVDPSDTAAAAKLGTTQILNTKGTNPGQVASVGALDVQNEVTEDAVFSKRNLVVNGLTLVGQVAGGYAFVGSTAAVQGIGAFNSSFIPNFAKFWPDRALDQEKFLLALGYRTDQSTAIAKDDHGSYYAFFPLSTFLVQPLKKLFLYDPAVFMNPAEAWLVPGGLEQPTSRAHRGKENLEDLRYVLMQLAQTIPGNSSITPTKLLMELGSGCDSNVCLICPKAPFTDYEGCVARVTAERTLFKKASLNTVQIVVRGVMTVDKDAVPPIIEAIAFDGEKTGAPFWTVGAKPAAAVEKETGATDKTPAATDATANDAVPANTPAAAATATKSGTVSGKFLLGSMLALVQTDVPGVTTAKAAKYIDATTVKTVSASSTDSSLAFTLALEKTLPPGTKLTFQASRPSAISAGAAGTASTSTQLTSNKFVYTVVYDTPAAEPSIKSLMITGDEKTDVFQASGTLSGTLTGTSLSGGTLSVIALQIDGKAATVDDYIGLIEVKSSDATNLAFQFSLLKAIPDGSKLSFTVSAAADDTAHSETWEYTVRKPRPTTVKHGPRTTQAHKAK